MLKAQQVAEKFNVSRSTINRWVEAGRFPRPLRIGEKAVRWREKDLEDFEAKAVERRNLSS